MSYTVKGQVAFSVIVWQRLVRLCAPNDDTPAVKTKQGTIAGVSTVVGGRVVNKYAGIPFAEAPARCA